MAYAGAPHKTKVARRDPGGQGRILTAPAAPIIMTGRCTRQGLEDGVTVAAVRGIAWPAGITKKGEMVMKWRYVPGCLVVWAVLCVSLAGCSKEEDAPPSPEQAPTKSSTPAPQPAAPPAQTIATEQSISPLIAEFLERKVRMRNVTAGDSVPEFFTSWENIFQRRSRQPLDLHFEVEVDGTFPTDHVWSSSSSRGILDELCQAYDLAWTVASPNAIRISAKTK